MLGKQYLETAQTLLRVARGMTDQIVADRLETLARDYEHRVEKARRAGAARGPLRSSSSSVCPLTGDNPYRSTINIASDSASK